LSGFYDFYERFITCQQMNQLQNIRFKVFDYLEELDCFRVNKKFKEVVDEMLLSEWSGVEWIGRYFTLDNDYGEHWFDNWVQREAVAGKVKSLGFEDESELLIIDPKRLANYADGPCHSDEARKQFWHDVLYNLELSLQTLANECRLRANEYDSEISPEKAEELIKKITKQYSV